MLGRRLVPSLLVALIALALPALSSAATYEVNSVADSGPQGPCESNSAGCTLRGAVAAANATSATADTIDFGPTFNGELADTITLASPLAPLTSPLRIDGGNCGPVGGAPKPCVGVAGVANQPVLDFEAGGSAARGLALTGGYSAIIVTESSSGFEAEGNWIGFKLDGSNSGGTQDGILIGAGSNGARIGGTATAQRNLISNYVTGLRIEGAEGTVVQGNWFGVGPSGSGAGTPETDIAVTDISAGGPFAKGTVIGGTVEGAALATKACDGPCNVIAGAGTGIDLQSPLAASGPTTISGNYLGLDPTGTGAVPNSNTGVKVNHAANVTLGGAGGEATANFFAGGAEAISHQEGVGLTVSGNRIGFGPVDNAPIQPPNAGIRATGVTGGDPAQLRDNLIRIANGGTAIESAGRGAEIVGNQILGGFTAIRTSGATGGKGNLIEGNATKAPDSTRCRSKTGPT